MGRRTTLVVSGEGEIELLALPDLVQAKKTQRDKDWPMIRRRFEAHHAANREAPSREQVRFWLHESRTPSMLVDVARHHPDVVAELSAARPLLAHAASGDETATAVALRDEEAREREADRSYWAPLRRELENLRRRGIDERGN